MHTVILRIISKEIKRGGVAKNPREKLQWNAIKLSNNLKESRKGEKDNFRKTTRG